MVPLDIRKEMKGRMGLNQEGRIGEIFMGAVIFIFRIAFHIDAFLLLPIGGFGQYYVRRLIFFYAFSIPFMMIGLLFPVDRPKSDEGYYGVVERIFRKSGLGLLGTS